MNPRRIVSLFLACCVLSWAFHAIPARGCCSGSPPGWCCWCASGVWVCQCTASGDCGTGWKCYYRCCSSCNIWDIDQPIGYAGDIYISPNPCPICWTAWFSNDIEDIDHYLRGWFWPYGTDDFYAPDSLTGYEWSVSPDTGVWQSNRFANRASWQAPPCLGTANVSFKVDDVPDPASDACPTPSSNRDDSGPKTFTDSVEIGLPPGCREGEESVEFLLNEVDPGSRCDAAYGNCGYTVPISPPRENHIDAVYSGCTWVFDIFIIWDVETGICLDVHDISSGDDSDLTEENYCTIVDSMKNHAGCVCIGLDRYTSYECTAIHEAYHLSRFYELLEGQEAFVKAGLPKITINCSDSATTTCGEVERQYMSSVAQECETAMRRAWDMVETSTEDDAVAAARACFTALAAEICDYASSEDWEACSSCE
jgi:hypothetical protein